MTDEGPPRPNDDTSRPHSATSSPTSITSAPSPTSAPTNAKVPGKSAKAALRSALRAARRARRDATSPAQRRVLAQRLADHLAPTLVGARCVASFEPLAVEPDVATLNEAVLTAGGRLIVPITLDDLDLSWRDAATGEDLGRHAIASADVIVTPALAVGPHGERLGQGGGCYDRALPRRHPAARVVAVVFADEVGQAVPVEAHDERVDAVLTEDGLTWFASPPRTP